ncbi:MAG: cell division protein FtsA, partial [Pseudomonadota bacterium]
MEVGLTTAARQSFRNERVVCLLDIGSSKIACLVVAIDARAAARHEDGWTTVQPDPGSFGSPAAGVVPNGAPMRVLGVGYTRSQGIKSGVITDMASAEAAVRTCVAQAETASGVTVERVHVAVSCGRLRSQSFAAHADIGPAGVNSADISRAFAGGRAYVHREGRCLLHMNCV